MVVTNINYMYDEIKSRIHSRNLNWSVCPVWSFWNVILL